MATNALISITKNGETQVKIIAGCDGRRAEIVTKILHHYMLSGAQLSLKDIYNISRDGGLGCKECLIVMSNNEIIYKGEDENTFDDYKKTFDDPSYNPRTNQRNIGYLYIIPMDDNYGQNSI